MFASRSSTISGLSNFFAQSNAVHSLLALIEGLAPSVNNSSTAEKKPLPAHIIRGVALVLECM